MKQKTRRVTIHFPEETYKRFRTFAWNADSDMTKLINRWVTEKIK